MRRSGILLHISSLPSPYGIGTFGKQAYRFVDFLKEARQHYWQILPIGPTGYGDSPYQSYSSYAGNPYFIDLDLLKDRGLLKKREYQDINWSKNDEEVDYGIIYQERSKVLKKAYARFDTDDHDYLTFIDNNAYWLDDYSLFMAIKETYGMRQWLEWPKVLRDHDDKALIRFYNDHRQAVEYHKVIQYLFYRQWSDLKAYANEAGIAIIGDLPIYCALDSADVWKDSDLFLLGEDKRPAYIAGVPGDAFNPGGQLWGNPLYDWQKMQRDGYRWWCERIVYQNHLFDVVRLDHFRGFVQYFKIRADENTARNGFWEDGPGYDLFKKLRERYGDLNIIAEDLGVITDDVRALLEQCGYMGMKVLEFAFDHNGKDSDYLPHNIIKDCVAYIGTHDNETINGWLKNIDKEDRKYLFDYLNIDKKSARIGILKSLWASVSDTVIVQAQDILNVDKRMNTPSTSGGNWQWRAKRGSFNRSLARSLAYMMDIYARY